MRRYLRIDAAAEYLSLSPKAVYNRVARRTIPHSKLDGSLRFDITELDAWVKRNKRGYARKPRTTRADLVPASSG